MVTAQYTPSATSIFTGSSGQGSVTLTEPGVAATNGNNTFNGNQTVNGMVTATAFSGDGSKLSNVTASALSSSATVAGSQVTGAISGSQITGPVANATNAVNAMNLTGSIFDTQVTNLGADLTGATNAAVNMTEAFVNKTFLSLAGGTLTGSLNGPSANFNSVQIGGGTPISEYISVTDNVGSLAALNAGLVRR